MLLYRQVTVAIVLSTGTNLNLLLSEINHNIQKVKICSQFGVVASSHEMAICLFFLGLAAALPIAKLIQMKLSLKLCTLAPKKMKQPLSTR